MALAFIPANAGMKELRTFYELVKGDWLRTTGDATKTRAPPRAAS
jgi:hypothetical protein